MFNKRRNRGTTIFAPMKVVPDYSFDEATRTVTGVVQVEGTVYLTVQVGERTIVKGSLRKIKHLVRPFKKKHYIDMIEREAKQIQAGE